MGRSHASRSYPAATAEIYGRRAGHRTLQPANIPVAIQPSAPARVSADVRPRHRARHFLAVIAGVLVLGLVVPALISEISWQRFRAEALSGTNGQVIERSNTDDNGYLELVNSDHAASGNADGLVSAWPTVPVRVDGIKVRPSTLDAVADLFDAARNDGISSLFVSSGYRTADQQQQLWDNAGDRNYVLPAGFSEHQTGLAVDILATGG